MKNLFKAALFAITLTSLISCSKNEAEGSDTESENLVQAVRVETLAKSDMRKFIEINGNIRAEKSMNVYPVIQGKIAGTSVHLGSVVKKGAVLAYVDPSVPGSRYALNEVVAPISGTVISIPLKEGTRVNTETSVVTIGDLSKLQIITYIPERYVSFLKTGLDANIVLEAYPDEKFTAKVSEVSPVLDEATRTKEVILTFSSPDSRINAGMFAGVNLYLKDYKDVLSVPTSCIIEKSGKKFVYVIEENALPAVQSDSSKDTRKVRFTEIKTGEEIVDRTIIEFAEAVTAQAGAVKVVTQGFEPLQDGSEVNITE